MTREARRREERAERKGRLDSDTVGRFNEARRLPPDHPSATSASPLLTSPEQAHRYLDLIRRSGVGAAIEARLGDHPGRRSRLRAEALLLAALLAASERQSYRRTDLCAVLNGLDARVAFRVGLCDRGTRTPISYSITHKQVQRIESALADGWIASDGQEWDLHWFSQWILRATIPREVATRITAVAVDSTFVESWAPSKDYSREADPLAAHRLASRDTPDLPEPELAAPARAATGIGSIGADGRRQRSADPDARPGWRSATAKRPAGVALGYDLHLKRLRGPRLQLGWPPGAANARRTDAGIHRGPKTHPRVNRPGPHRPARRRRRPLARAEHPRSHRGPRLHGQAAQLRTPATRTRPRHRHGLHEHRNRPARRP